ncbi:MAG: ACT domain-containing protein [Microbacter sp.]
MFLQQLSLFLENKTGRLTEVTQALSKHGINITAFSIADSENFGILRMIVDQHDTALKALKDEHFVVHSTDVVGFVIPNQPGKLYDALQHLDKTAIDIEYLYAFAHNGDAAVVIKTNNDELTANILKKNGYQLLEKTSV